MGADQISSVYQQTMDLDWFGLDQRRRICHFTTAGTGVIPAPVQSSLSNLKFLARFFISLLEPCTTPIVCPDFLAAKGFKSEAEKERYIRDFVKMAAKGLYSYDAISPEVRPSGYALVAFPSRPLAEEALPADVLALLSQISLPFDAAITMNVPPSLILAESGIGSDPKDGP